jgi:dinuclear metal center YbgI/SA1388 family protein
VITRSELASYLHGLLTCDEFQDYAPNGLQVEGKESIDVICTAVTASADVIREAIKRQADALIVHHGYFWRGESAELVGMKYARIADLIRHNINLFGYHLPLDCHPELGNNACLGRLLGVKSMTSHRVGKTPNLLWSGDLSESRSHEAMSSFITEILGRVPLVISGNDAPIRSIAWCTGGAQDYIVDAKALGVDAYLSGEVSERSYYQAKELGITYLACGHHATERYGIQALGKHLATEFGLAHYYIDSDNPV